jgi:hypothetical protein
LRPGEVQLAEDILGSLVVGVKQRR